MKKIIVRFIFGQFFRLASANQFERDEKKKRVNANNNADFEEEAKK